MNGVDYFEVPTTGTAKYVAVLKNGQRVRFGHRDYEHYKDTVPRAKGGGKWAHRNHLDTARRDAYRSRHQGVRNRFGRPAYLVKYSPAWFSWNYLW